jgi:6-phosphogluconolactonase
MYSFLFDGDTGEVKNLGIAAEAVNPEFIALSPSKKRLYVTHETSEFRGQPTGSVSAFAAGGSRGETLSLMNQVSSGGRGPCHIALDTSGTRAVVSHYTEGAVAVFPIHADGSIGECIQTVQFTGKGPNKARQEAPHAHSCILRDVREAAQGYSSVALACDLGSDNIWTFSYDRNRREPLQPLDPPFFQCAAGSGPRHTLFHPSKDIAYAVHELSCTIDVLSLTGGRLSLVQTVPLLPPELPPRTRAADITASAIKFGADARFLYASIRGRDSIVTLRVMEEGLLEPVAAIPSGGRMPRDFAVDPTGAFLLVCHQESDNLVVFRIDRLTGLLEKVREYEVLSGVCIIV